MKKNKLVLLQRANGTYGIYLNKELISNSFQTDRVDLLLNRLLYSMKQYGLSNIRVTNAEDEFKSALPSLEEYLAQMQ